MTTYLGIIELTAKVARLEIHTASALSRLAKAKPTDRYRHNGRTCSSISRYARAAVRNGAALKRAREALADAQGRLA